MDACGRLRLLQPSAWPRLSMPLATYTPEDTSRSVVAAFQYLLHLEVWLAQGIADKMQHEHCS